MKGAGLPSQEVSLLQSGDEQNPAEVAAYLSSIAWGADYPEEFLVVGAKEQAALDSYSAGDQSFAGLAKNRWDEEQIRCQYNAALAKQELAVSRDVDIQDLSERAKRVLVLNDIFGADWVDRRATVMSRRLSPLIMYTAFMDQTFGRVWRGYPTLWNHSIDSIKTKTDLYDKHLDPSWRSHIDVLGSSSRTVLSSARALPYIGVTPSNTPEGTYIQLLRTRMSTKQKQMIYIRRSILGHTQIRHSSQKRKKSTLAARKALQTEANRETERAELEELRIFIAHVGVRYLLKSNSDIAGRAYDLGYVKDTQS